MTSAKLAAGVLGARAYGHVNMDGSLDASRTKNVDSVTQLGTGQYCVVLSAS